MPPTARQPLSHADLSLADRAWLNMDEPTNPMVITALLELDAPLDHAGLVRFVRERLLTEPRFRQRLAPGRSARLRWEDDARFDVRAHVHHVALPRPGDDEALQELVGDLMSTRLDPDRPLWQVHQVDGHDGGSAIVVRLHHAMADGVALVGLLERMVGAEQRDAPVVRGARSAPSLRRGVEGARAIARLAIMPPDARTPLRGALGLIKRAALSRPWRLADLTAVAHANGGTVNDVLASAVAGGLRRWLGPRGGLRDGLEVRAILPVNLRDVRSDHALGNRFGLVFLPLPVGIADGRARLAEVVRRTRVLKDGPEAAATYEVLGAMALAPRPVEDLGVTYFGAKATLVFTDLAGPREPVTIAGGRVRSIAFWAPQAARLGLGVSALSYAGELRVGVASDAGIVADPREIVAGLEAEIASLYG